MHQMIELHPRPDALSGLGLPAIPYPVALQTFQAAVANDGELPLADMLHGLQLRASAPGAKWQPMIPAMARLAELLAGDTSTSSSVEGEGWWLQVGAVDLRGPLVAMRRGDTLLATLADRGDGRLRLATWQPLDALTADLLIDLAATRDACAAWARAHAAAMARSGDPQADGALALAWHPEGLVIRPGDDVSGPRPASHVAAELAVRHGRAHG